MALKLKEMVYIISGAVMFLNGSCLSIHYQEGKTILGATTDTILNGSSSIIPWKNLHYQT
jgi:hypothetical protein